MRIEKVVMDSDAFDAGTSCRVVRGPPGNAALLLRRGMQGVLAEAGSHVRSTRTRPAAAVVAAGPALVGALGTSSHYRRQYTRVFVSCDQIVSTRFCESVGWCHSP